MIAERCANANLQPCHDTAQAVHWPCCYRAYLFLSEQVRHDHQTPRPCPVRDALSIRLTGYWRLSQGAIQLRALLLVSLQQRSCSGSNYNTPPDEPARGCCASFITEACVSLQKPIGALCLTDHTCKPVCRCCASRTCGLLDAFTTRTKKRCPVLTPRKATATRSHSPPLIRCSRVPDVEVRACMGAKLAIQHQAKRGKQRKANRRWPHESLNV